MILNTNINSFIVVHRITIMDKLTRNMEIINSVEFDDFDKLAIIRAWFYHFTDGQKANLIDILEVDSMRNPDVQTILKENH